MVSSVPCPDYRPQNWAVIDDGESLAVALPMRNRLMQAVLVALIAAAGISPLASGLAATPLTGADTAVAHAGPKPTKEGQPLYIYTISATGTPASYDEAMAVASLQGIINRKSPEVYVLSHRIAARNSGWICSQRTAAGSRDASGSRWRTSSALVKLAGSRLRGAVIWDPAVPASVNVATTIAGVRDAVVLSPELADRYLAKWRLPVLKDLRGQFTGAETGSRKNDAYRWAIREYLAQRPLLVAAALPLRRFLHRPAPAATSATWLRAIGP